MGEERERVHEREEGVGFGRGGAILNEKAAINLSPLCFSLCVGRKKQSDGQMKW